jgi:hypothetical protein
MSAWKNINNQVTREYTNGAVFPITPNQVSRDLYKNPSMICGAGTTGCRNKGNFSTSPYKNNAATADGLLLLKSPVTFLVKIDFGKIQSF